MEPMRTPLLLPALALLAACGSNVPPPPEQQNRSATAQPMGPMTGNQDRDFASMMITHHQGAIDMARQQLARGRDPEMRALANKVIADQQREIAQMQAWLEKSGGGSAEPRAQ